MFPEVRDDLRSFRRRGIERAVHKLLLGIPAGYVAGIEAIVLRDAGGLTRAEKKRRSHARGQVLLGTHQNGQGGQRAVIHLFVDSIMPRWPAALLVFPFFRELLLATVLYHEVGHHIHAAIEPRHVAAEAAAEAWSRRLTKHYFSQHYWYLIPILVPMVRVIQFIRRGRR
jgi:hypothetical protein